MNYPLFINATLCWALGFALLMVWRHGPEFTFARYLGWANLVQALLAMSYWLPLEPYPLLNGTNKILQPFAAASYAAFFAIGTALLAKQALTRRTIALVFFGSVFLGLTAMLWHTPLWAHVAYAGINTMISLAFVYWIQRTEFLPQNIKKWLAFLLLALGLDQLFFTLLPAQGLALQLSLDSLLRITLGLVLLYAALQRTTSETLQLKQRLTRLNERMHQGIVIIQDDKVVYANPASLKIFGILRLPDLSLDTVLKPLAAQAKSQVLGAFEASLTDQAPQNISHNGLHHRKDGLTMWLRYQIFKTQCTGRPATQILLSDETKRHHPAQSLLPQVLHDELTGLPNRMALLNGLRVRCSEPTSAGGFTLVLIDIDRFKLFNAAHGRSMGDEMLKIFAHALRAAIDPRHEVMRAGGDKFAVVSASELDADMSTSLTAAMRQLLSSPLRVAERDLFLDASMGIALYPHCANSAESLLRAADTALQEAKGMPGTSHKFAERAFERGSNNALEQERALRKGIDNAEFYLLFQPQVDAHTNKLTGFEALARWHRANIGPVDPLQFITATEHTGLINALGSLLLQQACQQIAAWHKQYGTCVPIGINISPLQLLDPAFPTSVAHILQSCHVEPRWLILEITESSAVQNLEQTVHQIALLQDLGIRVAMDDFGTGFSSLNMLRALRLHTIKIDQNLITPLPSSSATAVVQAICQVAQTLHIHVLAQGVETESQAAAARDAGCCELQGYLYDTPLNVEDAAAWLELSLRHPDAS